MRKYLVSLLYILVIAAFLSAGCTSVKREAVKGQPVEKPAVKEQVEKAPAAVEEAEVTGREIAADFQLQDLNQQTFSLSSYKNKQPVILFFWTTWCPFSQTEIRSLKNIYPQLVKEGWELFAIDLGESSRKVESLVKNLALNFKVLLDETGSTADSYGILGVPTYVIIDSKGRIVTTDHQFPKDYNKLIAG